MGVTLIAVRKCIWRLTEADKRLFVPDKRWSELDKRLFARNKHRSEREKRLFATDKRLFQGNLTILSAECPRNVAILSCNGTNRSAIG